VRPFFAALRALTRRYCRLAAPITYTPRTAPGPFPPLRLAAYEAASGQLLGPDDDPAGWHVLPPVVVAGRLFGARDVEVTCVVRVFCLRRALG
jgi:hypothetical protein